MEQPQTVYEFTWMYLNGGASFRWSIGPFSAWGSIESTTILTTHSSLEKYSRIHSQTQKIRHYFLVTYDTCGDFITGCYVFKFSNSIIEFSQTVHRDHFRMTHCSKQMSHLLVKRIKKEKN